MSRWSMPGAACRKQAAAALDARLVLVLANHIGDLDVLRQAIAVARKDSQ